MMSHDNPLIIEANCNASPAKIWEALTHPEQMKQWGFDIPGFKAEVGFEFSFEGGKDPEHPYIHLCKVTEVIPERKLSHTWHYKGYPGDTLVSYELVPVGAQTKVILTHTGLETFPEDNPDLARENFEAGWKGIIGESLKGFVEKDN